MMLNHRRVLLGLIASACVPAALWIAESQAAAPSLSVQQIVEKHVAARGGLQAWRAIQTMSWSGSMDAGSGDSVARSKIWVAQTWGRKGTKQAAPAAGDAAKDAAAAKSETKQMQLPFVMDVKRPGMSRVELEFAGKKSIQVFDGKNGWMKRPYLNRDDWEPFSKDQTDQIGKWDVDGPLFDYAAKGTKVTLEGVDKVDGQDSYRLKLTLKDGKVQHVWIDAHSFLDVKVEAVPRRMDGRMHPVYVYQRDFRKVDGGVLVPFVMETVVDGYPDSHKMLIEKVGLNPKLDDALFTKPTA